jgi:pSer/pThr/pTyr-binding forkhead associated (FHA) protein
MKVITIGREKNNDIVINDVKVSRNHLQIAQDNNGVFTVVDLGSTNGTFVNDERLLGSTSLKLGDKVRIGDTNLLWYNYFETKRQSELSFQNPINRPARKPSHTMLYVVGAIVLLFLAGGGIAYKILSDKKRERVEAERMAKTEEIRIQQEVRDKDADAARLQAEVDSLLRQAVASNSAKAKELRELAEKKQQEANMAKNEANIAKEAQLRAEIQRDDALQAQQTAEGHKAEADRRVREEQERATVADERADEARAEQANALKALELTREFHSLSKMTTKSIQDVYEKMKWELPQDKIQRESNLITQFDNADNNQKQKIIEIVREVLGQQNREEQAEGQARQDSTNSVTLTIPDL